MRTEFFLAFTGLSVTILASPFPEVQKRQLTGGPCQDVHIFTARGSFEGYGLDDNRQNRLVVPAVCDGRESCGYEDIEYPATLDENYCGSQTKGVSDGRGQLQAYAERCPKSKLVLVGYSQGAQVMGDILGTGGAPSCDAGNPPLDPDTSPGNMIKAVVLFGDTRRTPGQEYNNGSAGKDSKGMFPRSQDDIDALNEYASQLGSWCVAGDNWCTEGDDGDAHSAAVETYWEEAANFINSKL